jgi:hypothetical protein
MPKAIVELLDGRKMQVEGPTEEAVRNRINQVLEEMKGGPSPFLLPSSPRNANSPGMHFGEYAPEEIGKAYSPEQMRASQGTMGARYSPGQLAAAQTGVDISSGAPVGRFVSGFSQNQSLQAEDLKKRLEAHYGQPIETRLGPYSQDVEFKNPQTGRFTTANEARLTLRDLAGLAGPAITAAGGLTGELLGGPLGAAGGGFLGESLRRGIGHALGVRDKSSQEEGIGALGAGAIEGGGSLAGRGLARGQQAVRDFIFPKPYGAREAENILARTQANQKVADEISDATGQEFRPFTGQLADDPTLLAEQQRMLSSTHSGAAARDRMEQNESILEAYFYSRTPTGPAMNTNVGRAVQNEARDQTQPRIDQIEEGINREIGNLENMTRLLPQTSDMSAGERVRGVIASRRQQVKGQVDAMWGDVRQSYGYNPETSLSAFSVPVSGNLEVTLKRFAAEAREAIDPATATGKRTLLPPKLAGGEETALEKEINEMLVELGESAGQGHSVDLHQMQVLLQSLRRRERIAYTNVNATDPEMRDMTTLRDALITQRNEYLGRTNPELLGKIEAAENARRNLSEVFDRGAVGQILRKTNGEYVIADSDVVGKAIASGQPEAMRHLVSVMSKHPAGMSTLQESMLAFYRQEVVENGLPRGALHARFIGKYGDALDILFPGQGNVVRRLGEIESVVTRNVKRFDDFRARVNKTFRGRIQELDPERVAEDVLTRSFSQKDVASLMSLARNSGFGDQYKQAIGNMVARKYVALNGGIKLDALNSFVQANQEKLSIIFGQQYISDMRRLVRGLEIARSRAAGIAASDAPSLIEGVVRTTLAPPLSSRGVALTRTLKFRQAASNRLMNEILMNPRKLSEFVTRANTDLRHRAVAGFLATAGASSLAIQESEK